jgi:hypothetical protein
MGIDIEAMKARGAQSLFKLYRAYLVQEKKLVAEDKDVSKCVAERRRTLMSYKKLCGRWPTVDDLVAVLGLELVQAERDEIAADLEQLKKPVSRKR